VLLDLSFLSTGESQHVFLSTGEEDPRWVYKLPAAFGYVLPFSHARQRFRPRNRREQLVRLVAMRLPRFLRRKMEARLPAATRGARPAWGAALALVLALCHRASVRLGDRLLAAYCRRRNRKRFRRMLSVIEYLSRHGLDDILLPHRVIRRGRALLRVEGRTISYAGPILVQKRASFFERPSGFDTFRWADLVEAEHRLWRRGVGFGTFAETVGPKNWALSGGRLLLADTGSLTRDVRVALDTLRPDKVERKLRNTMRRLVERGQEAGADEYFRFVLSEINCEKLRDVWRTDLGGRQLSPAPRKVNCRE
jgi:hypothetical protein